MVVLSSAFLVLATALAVTPSVFGTGTSGNVQLDTEIATSIAMKIVSPNDVNPDCTPESGVTYGVVNRYASSTGDDSGKMVDTFNGNEGEADELNTNTSCATLSMTPNTFDSTYSDVTVYTNSGTGYAVTLQSAENVSPNLVNTADSTQYIEAGALTESEGTVAGGQNKWAYKTNGNLVTDWTAATTSPVAIKSYDSETSGGDTTRVTYGISAGSNPTGKYTTTLTYTATMFDGANPYVGQISTGTSPDSSANIVPQTLQVAKGSTKTITLTPRTGYYLSSVSCPEGYTCTGYTTGSPSDPNATSRSVQDITITNNDNDSGTDSVSFTLGNTYRINFSKSSISSPSASYIDVPYGESVTVTVTPASGYYLSGFSGCPSGWTCSGVSTGTSYTGNQTLTLKNNSSTSIGTLTLTGTVSDPFVNANCGATAGSTCTVGGVSYKRLADGHLWTTSSRGTANWYNAASLCPANTHVPSAQELRNLVMAYGGYNNPDYGSPYGTYASSGALYNATGWSGDFWSATEYASNTSSACSLGVDSSYSFVAYNGKTSSFRVVCVH